MIENKILKKEAINYRKETMDKKAIHQSNKKYKSLNMDNDKNYIMEQFPLIGRTKFPSTAYKKHKTGNLIGEYVSKDLWITDAWKKQSVNYGTPTGNTRGFLF